jgi:transglutaminase-like putative cysteine protease
MRYTLLLFLLLFTGTITAQHKNFAITPAPSWLMSYFPDLTKKPNPRDISDGYYLVLVEEQDHVEKRAVYHHIIRQIVSEAGIQNGAEISIEYDPAYEKLNFHQVIIRRNGEVINKMQASRFKFLQQEEELSRFIYSGLYTAYFLLEDVRKGDQIEYAYTVEGTNPIFEDKYSASFYQSASDPILNYYECLIAGPSRDIRFKAFNNAKLPDSRELNGMKIYEWKFRDLKPTDGKTNTPSWYSSFPFVQVSEYKEWKEVIDWGCRINTTPASGPALLAKIAELKKESGDNKELYFQKAIRFVQDDIRYMGIEMGEYSHRPNTPDKILSQRFGDCKDKSLLLATLLNANGIPANMAYTDTDEKQYIEDYLPAPDLFNHAIVYATFNGKGLWIDPTISYQRGTISSLTIPDYGKALVIRPGNTTFTTVGNEGKGLLKVEEIFTLPDYNNKKGSLQVNTIYNSMYADNVRGDLANSSVKDEETSYLNYYKKNYSGITTDSAMEIIDADSANTLETIERYQLISPWKADSTNPGRVEFTVYAGILRHILPAYPDEEKMDAPLELRYPYKLDYTIKLKMPEDWTFDEPDYHVKNPYYKLDFKLVTNGKLITIHYNFETFQDNVPVKYLATYLKDRRKMEDILSYSVYWAPAGSATTPPKSSGALNWLAIGLALMVAAFFIYEALQFYKRPSLPAKEPLILHPISGWLILVGIGTVLRPFTITIKLFSSSIFAYSTWQALARLPNATGNLTVLELIVCVELIVNVFLIVYSVLLLFLFFKRRNTFPVAMIYFLLINLLFVFIDTLLTHFVFKHTEFSYADTTELLQAFVAGAIWTPYFLRSQQVKETFIMPHDS